MEIQLDKETEAFLRQYHRMDPKSEFYFQPYKSSDSKKKWVSPKYPSGGLQAINTQTFGSAFIHGPKTRIWGWTPDYVSTLASKLPKQKKIPVFHLVVWLYREKDWPKDSSIYNTLNFFIEEFRISRDEKDRLFDFEMPLPHEFRQIVQKSRASWNDLRPLFPQAPDARPEQGGTLAYLEIRGLGPAEHFILQPGRRLTIITGDNGLGKTFLLECAWWALTGNWADIPAFPRRGSQKSKVEITFDIEGERANPDRKSISFDWRTLSWPETKKRPTIPGLILYARADASFGVWDPAKHLVAPSSQYGPKTSVFTGADVWNGLTGKIEGLIRDWTRWQNNPSKHPFETFTRVLSRLSPPDLGRLEPGESVRIPDDPRDIPTIRHSYGETPIVYASAGVRRIITLAYVIVWAWNEHLIAAELGRSRPQRRMVVLIDEIDAHLHPRWQRVVLPAIMSIGDMLSSNLELQLIVSTHSPMVMASAEPVFDFDMDSLFHLDITEKGKVSLNEFDFVRFGDISSWLTSRVFDLRHARSLEAEAAMEAAKALQLQEELSVADVQAVSERLVRYLAQDDKFWPRWISFAEKYGVEL